MKKTEKILLFLLIISLIITLSMVASLNNHIKQLETELQNNMIAQANVIQWSWDSSKYNNTMYGTVRFDTLKNVKKMYVSYKDNVHNDLSVINESSVIDYSQNICVISFGFKYTKPTLCRLDVVYTNGFAETLYLPI